MGHQRQHKSDNKYAQKRRRVVAESDELQNADAHDPFVLSPNGILHLQRTIGNQAVQRLIAQSDLLQRQPTGQDAPQPSDTKESQKQASLPSFVASITGRTQGKFKGGSRIAGHEGKIEVLSISFEPSEKTMTVHLVKPVDESSAAFSKALLAGEPLSIAQFDHIRRNDKGDVETVKTFEFSDGFVTNLQYGGESEGIPLESITLEFSLKSEKE